MPGLGWTELLIVAALAIIVVGPKDLPILLRTIGRFVGKARALAREFQESFEEIAREAELEELRKENEKLRQAAANVMTPVAPAPTTPATAPLTPNDESKLREATNAQVLAAEAKSAAPMAVAPTDLAGSTSSGADVSESSNITPFRGGARR